MSVSSAPPSQVFHPNSSYNGYSGGTKKAVADLNKLCIDFNNLQPKSPIGPKATFSDYVKGIGMGIRDTFAGLATKEGLITAAVGSLVFAGLSSMGIGAVLGAVGLISGGVTMYKGYSNINKAGNNPVQNRRAIADVTRGFITSLLSAYTLKFTGPVLKHELKWGAAYRKSTPPTAPSVKPLPSLAANCGVVGLGATTVSNFFNSDSLLRDATDKEIEKMVGRLGEPTNESGSSEESEKSKSSKKEDSASADTKNAPATGSSVNKMSSEQSPEGVTKVSSDESNTEKSAIKKMISDLSKMSLINVSNVQEQSRSLLGKLKEVSVPSAYQKDKTRYVSDISILISLLDGKDDDAKQIQMIKARALAILGLME